MLFNSLEYLFFLPIVWSVYWLLHRRVNLQNAFILAASYFFYGLWDYRFLSLIILSSATDYVLALAMQRNENANHRKQLLMLSLFVNLGLLMVFKYYNFFIESFIEAFGVSLDYPTLQIILPVGISFYTFQTLSYTIDVYRQRIEPTRNALTFFTYVAFFPQLVAGPIERAINLLPQFAFRRQFNYHQAADGLRQILWGLFKKVVVADNCALFVDAIFENYGELQGGILALGALLFAIQIYGDFSGYSDIAIGTAKLFGIQLMQNFATPYFAQNIADFWRRWHISLTTWFRDYLYYPLGGNRSHHVRNVFIVFLISGLWHGANWTFLFWGLLHAVFYLVYILIKGNATSTSFLKKETYFSNVAKIILTFSVVTFAWIFFRSASVTDGFLYVHRLFQPSSVALLDSLHQFDLYGKNLVSLFIFIAILMAMDGWNRDFEHGLQRLSSYVVVRYVLYLMLCLLVLEYFYGQRSFIYFQF